MPRHFVTPNGFTVLVGKNASDNDRVSFQIARAHDLWFHAKDIPGAHVVLQWDGVPTCQPTQEDINFAAHAAAFYSKAKTCPSVPVVIARGCDISKIPNARKGAVHCNSMYELVANPILFYQHQQMLLQQQLQQQQLLQQQIQQMQYQNQMMYV
jgi:predicted ribosome quality control (RQC) complex YloA/Tae2 family protein